MIVPAMDHFAQLAVERALNSLPAGILIAFGASLLLRLFRGQNPGTRFAVWFTALAAVAVLPFLRFSSAAPSLIPHSHFAIVLSPFWASAFFLLWVPLAALALSRLAIGLWHIRKIRRNSTEITPPALDPELRALFDENPHPVRLLISDQVRTPSAIGFFRPAIVLPPWILSDFSPAELRPILIHELAHLRRRDSWTNLFQKTVRALFFFHPAVWWIDIRLSIEREMACDDVVLAATVSPDAYAGSLIGLLEKSCARRGWTMAQAAVSRAREASERITRILSSRGSATTRIAPPALAVAAAVFAACGSLALTAPRLLTFAPHSEATASLIPLKPLPDMAPGTTSDTNPDKNGVVLAAWHPAQTAHATPHRNARHAATATHRPVLRAATLHPTHKPRRTVAPFVMVGFVTSGPAVPSIAVPPLTPALLVIDTPTATYVQPVFELPAPARPQTRYATPPEIRIQTLRYVQQTPAGFSAGYINILITPPAQNAAGSDLFSLTI